MKLCKSLLAVLLALLLVCPLTALAAEDALPKGAVLISNSNKINAKEVTLIAYRGLSACAPENTLAAISLAGRCGCDGVALDIQPTVGGDWICFSDVTVDRLTNGVGVASAKTAADLDALTIDSGNNLAAYPSEKIPSLRQALVQANLYNLKVVLTIKAGSDEATQLVIDKLDTLLSTLKLCGVMSTVTVISAEERVLTAVKNAGGRAALNTLVPILAVNTCKDKGYVGISAPITDPVTLKLAANSNLVVYGTDASTITIANLFYDAGLRTIVSSSIVRHAPTQENTVASIFSTVSTAVRSFFAIFLKFFQDMFTNLALDKLFGITL